ncbi:hypothetical protein GCM10022402_27810 [Salinactinospora qingdaonensis]|uniref:Uncharacterized protein n=1 Tax=Salinactinospora qingdaonensis TaxID=702744 RepID=A0ABP7FT68_9ACTN
MAGVSPQSGEADMRTQIPEDVLDLVQRWLGLRLERDTTAYGNTGTTAGFRTQASAERKSDQRVAAPHGGEGVDDGRWILPGGALELSETPERNPRLTPRRGSGNGRPR